MNDFLAQVLEFFRHAGPVAELYVLCQDVADLALGLDVIADILSSERDGCIVTHYTPVID